jgi:hypothetical protein
LDDSASYLKFLPLEIEGNIFFDGQPVAVLPMYPTSIHPLMDDVIFRIMRTVSSLQVIVVLPDHFFSHLQEPRRQMSWARKLVRRLWSRGGTLYHRIRLLPAPLSDQRLLQLLRHADMMLDSFPYGVSLHTASLALSVGTPIVTLRSGVLLHTPREDLAQIRSLLSTHPNPRDGGKGGGRDGNINAHNRNLLELESNPMYQHIMRGGDMPWAPAYSAVSGFYHRAG